MERKEESHTCRSHANLRWKKFSRRFCVLFVSRAHRWDENSDVCWWFEAGFIKCWELLRSLGCVWLSFQCRRCFSVKRSFSNSICGKSWIDLDGWIHDLEMSSSLTWCCRSFIFQIWEEFEMSVKIGNCGLVNRTLRDTFLWGSPRHFTFVTFCNVPKMTEMESSPKLSLSVMTFEKHRSHRDEFCPHPK